MATTLKAETIKRFNSGKFSLPQELLKRELPGIYGPQLGINLTKTQTSSTSESLGEGHIKVGSADIKVKGTAKLSGLPVEIEGDFTVEGEALIIEGEQLESHGDQQTLNLNLTVSAVGDPYQVGASTSHCQHSATEQVNAHVHIGGTLHAHLGSMTLDGAVVDAQKATGEIDTLTVISRTDEVHNKNDCYSASTGGDFAMNHQKSDSRIVREAAEFHVRDSLEDTQGLKIEHIQSTGGKITSDGEVNLTQVKTIEARSVDEYQASNGFSISGNIKDFKQDTQTNHLFSPDKQSRQITTTNLGFNQGEYAAENQTVIHGAKGTHVQAGSISGDIVTNSSDGKQVTKDSSHHYNVVVPHMTEETKQQFAENSRWAGAKLKEAEQRAEKVVSHFFKPAGKPKPSPEILEQRHQETPLDSKKVSSHGHHSNGAENKGKEKEVIINRDSQKDIQDNPQSADHQDNSIQSPSHDREAIKEAYADGKRAAATGNIPQNIDDYPEDIQASFYMGYNEVKYSQYGAMAGVAILGGAAMLEAAAVPVAEKILSDVTTLGLRVCGLFRSSSNLRKISVGMI